MNICSTVLFLLTSGRGPAVWSCSRPGMWLELKDWDKWMRKGVTWCRVRASLSPPLGLTMDGGLGLIGYIFPHHPPKRKKTTNQTKKSHQTTWHKPVSAQEKKARDCGGRVVAHGIEECLLLFWKPVVPGCAPGSPRALLPSSPLPEHSSWSRRDY